MVRRASFPPGSVSSEGESIAARIGLEGGETRLVTGAVFKTVVARLNPGPVGSIPTRPRQLVPR